VVWNRICCKERGLVDGDEWIDYLLTRLKPRVVVVISPIRVFVDDVRDYSGAKASGPDADRSSR
jgi:hypothetical protein